MNKEEFCARFVTHMLAMAPFAEFSDGDTVEKYARETAPLYFDNSDQRADGPEECAEADISCWGEQ